jgi:hypothetical protein
VKEVLGMVYEKEQEEASPFVSVNTLVGVGNKPKEFHYIVRQGDGYWSLARYIMKNSGRVYVTIPDMMIR